MTSNLNRIRQKSIRERSVKRTDALKTLCNFMKNVSKEWDIDESKRLTLWYVSQYYKSIEEDGDSEQELQQRHNNTLLHTLSLWTDFHFLCPLIHDFNIKSLEKVDADTLQLLLPQILFAAKNTRDLELVE